MEIISTRIFIHYKKIECIRMKKIYATAAGFEPTKDCPIAFRVQRLNHSAKQPRTFCYKNYDVYKY